MAVFKSFIVLFILLFSGTRSMGAELCPVVNVLRGDFAPGLETFDENQSLSNLGFSPRQGGEMTVGGFTFFNDGVDQVRMVQNNNAQQIVHFNSERGQHIYIRDKARGCGFLYRRNGNQAGDQVAIANCNPQRNPGNPSCPI